jgi:methyl-accepting chemotaxis protein
MRFLLNLSVGRKLAASAALSVLLLVTLVLLVREQGAAVVAAQHDEARADAALSLIEQGAEALREVPVLERDLLLTQDAAGQDPARAQLLARLEDGMSSLASGIEAHGHPAMLAHLPTLRAVTETYGAALGSLATERARLIELRDARLFGQSGEYDSIFEAVSGSLAFDLTGEAEEAARERLMTVHAAVGDVRLGVQRLLSTGEETQIRRVRRGIAQVRVHGRSLAGIEAPPRLREDFARLGASATSLAQAAYEILAAGDAVATLRVERLEPARQALQGELGRLAETSHDVGAERRDLLLDAAQRLQDIALWTGIAIALVVVLSGLAMARTIGAPLRRLAGAMRGIAAGDTGVTVPDRGRRDEIGTIADALEALRGTVGRAFAQGQMLEQLPTAVMNADPRDGFRITYMNAETQRLLDRIKDHLPVPPDQLMGQSIDVFHRDGGRQRAMLSDQTKLPHSARIKLGGEVLELRISAIRDAGGAYSGAMLTWTLATEKVRLADTFEREVGAVVEAVATSAERLQASARDLSGAAATSGVEAAAVAEAGGRATADVQSVAAAAEEMAASVTEIARRVGEAAEVASRAVAEARQTDATVQGLSDAAARIGDVVRLIGDIAGQTNLLALNATIEAARAGEAGKGFAVVAGEVKILATRTAAATGQIGQQIATIQAETERAVAAIDGIAGTIRELSEVATSVAAASEQQAAATQEIGRAVAQAAAGVHEAARHAGDARSGAARVDDAAAGLRDAAARMAANSGSLDAEIQHFLGGLKAA